MTERADSQSQDHTTSLEHYLAPLRDHRKVILLVTAATLVLGVLIAVAGPQRYTARTSVLIYPVAAGPTEALQGAQRSDDMATELRIAESRAVAEMTATELDALGIDVDTSTAAAAITVANPEDSRVLTLSYQASEPATARVGSELAAAAYLAYRSELNAASRQVARTSINDEIAVLQDRLTVAEEQLDGAAAGSSARLVAEVELASIDAELEAQQDALADLSTLSIDAATVFDEANEPSSADGLGSAQLLVGALAGGLILGVIAAWTLAALGLPSGSLLPARTIGTSNRSDDDDDDDDGDEPSDVDSPFDDSDNRDPLELLKALEAVEADPAISLQPASEPTTAADAEPAAELETQPQPETQSEHETQSEANPEPETQSEHETQPELQPETQPTAGFLELPNVVQPVTLDGSVAMAEPLALPEPAALAEPTALPEPTALAETTAPTETAALPEPIAGDAALAFEQPVPFDESPFEEPMAFEAPLTTPELAEPVEAQVEVDVEVEVEVAPSAEYGVADETDFPTAFDATFDTDTTGGFVGDVEVEHEIVEEFEAPAVTHGPLVAELQANATIEPGADEHGADLDQAEDHEAVLEYTDDLPSETDVEADAYDESGFEFDAEQDVDDRADIDRHDEVLAEAETEIVAETHDDTETESLDEVQADAQAHDDDAEAAGHDEVETNDEAEASLTTGDPRELDPGPPSWDGPFVGPTTWDQLSAMAAAIGGPVDETTPAESDQDLDAEQDAVAEEVSDADDQEHTEVEASAPVDARAHTAAGLTATNDIDVLFEKLSQLGSSGPVAVLSLSDRNPAAGLTAGFELADELRAVGANVLLIDARLENPVLDSLFDDGPGSGLAQVMTGDVVLGEAVRNLSGLDGLDLLTVGLTADDTADHLVGPAFQRLLAEARLTYHSIVVIGDAVTTDGAEASEDQEESAEVDRARSLAVAVDALIVGTADPVGTDASEELVSVLDSFDAPTLQLVTAPVPAASGTVSEASSV